MKTPGPGPKYVLPTLTGFIGHAPTHYRFPSNPMGVRLDKLKKLNYTPAPNKYDIRELTRYGTSTRPTCVLGIKPKIKYNISPGPNKYAPEQHPDTRFKTAPSYSLGTRKNLILDIKRTPCPLNYTKPSTIGPRVPDMKAAPAYSILGKSKKPPYLMPASPGPAKYGISPMQAYKKKAGSAIVLGPYPFKLKKHVPGPKYAYKFNEKADAPAYSLGVKHSPYERVLFLPEDVGDFPVL
ncbi:protein CIMAP1D-like isoform X2 [Rhodnius prolixus]